ncbi:integrating conjugative element protein [[Haemophilus] ducreyi]|uniref:Mannosyl-glycoprotein endo-beta-N-acetylglucosamidase-like domain-containing protein n=2 Tax=Haemophilus ducreyi TaxID=730 RepID=Q7VMQ1_HAEDU|nr:integrating conjugative element protein [[Haemophilus] ducreyi]AAP95805.1 hypothetical protein HD_0922 [[Haemophilus] ducreyi 35000HP]ASE07600.1 integrating conjugative element protein [[Haemophilus] ducreyi]
MSNFIKKSHIALSVSLFINLGISSPLYANSVMNKLDFSKADSILSDKVFYQIGGGVGYMAPPTRSNTINAAEFGIGWKANLMCGNFDIKTTIKNQLNGITEGFKDLYSNVIESATGAVASLPAMIIQRANPQLYDILTNGLYQGKIDFANLKTNCEEMSKRLADATLDGRWSASADMEKYKMLLTSEPDANKVQKQLEDNKGKAGKTWVGNQPKGGEGQEPIKLVEDVATAGYNILNNRPVLEKKPISGSNCSGLLCQTWEDPKQLSEWLTKVVGEQTLSTCVENCGTPTSSKPGVGLTPEIEEENIRTLSNLEKALNMPVPPPEVLAQLSSNTIPVTRGLIEALREDPDVELLSQRLASELALSKSMEKMLLARRSILAGMREPNVINNKDATDELEKILNVIDREIEQINMETSLQKSITGNTASAILQNKERRDINSGSHGLQQDSLDKRLNQLTNGTFQNETDTIDPNDINIQRKPIVLGVPSVASSGTVARPSFGGSGGTSTAGNPNVNVPNNQITAKSKKEFIQQAMPIAKAIEEKWGVPAEVVIAQAALESGWGKHVKGNAYFGIKGKGSQGSINFGTHEVINGKKISINDNFASYGGFGDAANGYGEFLNKNKRYREAFKHKDNPVEFAKAIARAGYATDPDYANKLTKIIQSNKFS